MRRRAAGPVDWPHGPAPHRCPLCHLRLEREDPRRCGLTYVLGGWDGVPALRGADATHRRHPAAQGDHRDPRLSQPEGAAALKEPRSPDITDDLARVMLYPGKALSHPGWEPL